MDNGPFRMGNSASSARGTGSRSVAPRSEVERALPAEEEAPRKAPAHHITHAGREPRGSGKKKLIIGGSIAVLVLVAVLCGWWAMTRGNVGAAIDGSKYQAVFFTNGQVYFGKLKTFNDSYMKLTDVYYLQAKTPQETDSKNPQATSNGSDVELIKLGGEVHGPTDEMIISKDQILFFENLKSDGKVSESISQSQSKK